MFFRVTPLALGETYDPLTDATPKDMGKIYLHQSTINQALHISWCVLYFLSPSHLNGFVMPQSMDLNWHGK